MSEKVTINNTASLLKNEHYKRYHDKKQEIKSKYPQEMWIKSPNTSSNSSLKIKLEEYIKNYRKLHKEYLKELGDLIFEPDGDFQKFSWENMSEADKVVQERKSRARLNIAKGHSYK